MLKMAQDALSNPAELTGLNDEINTIIDTGKLFNLNSGDIPSSFRALQLQAEAAGIVEGTDEYQDFMRYRGEA